MILNKYFKDEIFEYEIIKGILSFKSISPILRTKIKLKKNIILKDFKNNNIYIRDII